jgi:acetolactate synthase regulatory subunit
MSHGIKKASVVACYKNPEGVKRSVRKLKKHGFDIKKLSIAGKGQQNLQILVDDRG